MAEVLIGCPVRRREWILRPWFLFAEQAASVAGLTPEYIVALSPVDESRDVIEKCCADVGRCLHIVHTDERTAEPYQRSWSEMRYREMIGVRNQLLGRVRELNPDLFLSLDSDILIHEEVLANLIGLLDTFDAVGGKCYMTAQGTNWPSYGMFLNANGLLRPDADHIMPVDCIMAIKLMTPLAYAVDYRLHYQGEDAGWSSAAAAHGVRLGWDGRIASKHVMQPQQLDLVDPRCGY